jgi:hypothetical protein
VHPGSEYDSVVYPSAAEDYDVGDNGNSISFAIPFDILERKSRHADLVTRIRAATGAFMAMNDVFFDTHQSEDSQAIVYADSNERRYMWMRFLGFECDSYR